MRLPLPGIPLLARANARFALSVAMFAAGLACVQVTSAQSLTPPAHEQDHVAGWLHDHLFGKRPTPRPGKKPVVQLGPRPYYLVDDLEPGALKDKLLSCAEGPFEVSDFSIGHRGAALQFPEHTKESYLAAARMGAGIIECDATFTKDRQLVCRHDQCDLHTTTNILAISELAAKCRRPFVPYDAATDAPASAECCTSDLTLAEFKSLCGTMDGSNPKATTPEAFLSGTPTFRTDLYATCGTLVTHAESIQIIGSHANCMGL